MTDLKNLLDDATPGPWEAALERGCHGVIAHTLPEGGANFVAIVGNDADSPEKEPTRFANARLIAKAPDLAKRVLELEAAAERVVSLVDRVLMVETGLDVERVIAVKEAILADFAPPDTESAE